MAAKKKILIIDDDLTALDIVDFLFEDNGYQVVRQDNGHGALDCVAAEKPDFILVDLMMPGINGQDTVRGIRGLGVQVPIVAFTALDDPDVHEEARAAGCNAVITKPCKPAVLLKQVQSLL